MTVGSKKKFDYQTLVLNTRQIASFARSQRGVTRKENQDRFLVKALREDAVIAVLADGMGGPAGGEIAAQMAISDFEKIKDIDHGKELDFLKEQFLKSDKRILQSANQNPDIEDMGTTLIAVFIKNQKAYWSHVGDSRLFLLRKTRLKQITQDQTFARFLFNEGEITKEQITTHYSQHILDQCIGHGDCEPETGSFLLKKNDFLILSTDGLHKVLDQKKIKDLLSFDISIKTKTEKLFQKVLEAKGNDDISVIILHVL